MFTVVRSALLLWSSQRSGGETKTGSPLSVLPVIANSLVNTAAATGAGAAYCANVGCVCVCVFVCSSSSPAAVGTPSFSGVSHHVPESSPNSASNNKGPLSLEDDKANKWA